MDRLHCTSPCSVAKLIHVDFFCLHQIFPVSFFFTPTQNESMPRRTELESNIRLYSMQIHRLCTHWLLPEENAEIVLWYVFGPLLQLDPSNAEIERAESMPKFAIKCKHECEFRRSTRAMLDTINCQPHMGDPQRHINFFAHMVLNVEFVQNTSLYKTTKSKIKQVRRMVQRRECDQNFWSSHVLRQMLDQMAHTYSVSPSNKSVLCQSCNSRTSRALRQHWRYCHHHLCQRFDCTKPLPKRADTPRPHRASSTCQKKTNA